MVDITPARLSYTAGTVRNIRVAPARMSFTGGNFSTARETSATTSTAVPTLDRLTFADRIPGESEESFVRRVAIWQKTMKAIEDAFAAVNARVNELAILSRLSAVEAKAEVADDKATAAQAQADVAVTATEQTFQQIDPKYYDYYRDAYIQ